MSQEPTRELSSALYERACTFMPAGVNSPVRAFGAVHGDPLFIERGEGARLWDVDGNLPRLQRFLGTVDPRPLSPAGARGRRGGRAQRADLRRALPGGDRPGRAVVSAYPGLELVRFVSSGTEAVMSAVRLARGATGRDLVVKFTGCYHGHSDALLVSGGSGLATFGQSSSAGVTPGTVADTVVLPLDDESLVRNLFAERGHDIAAVLLEPLPANSGLLRQRPEYLRFLREITAEHGALLIFDEVISGFRLGMGGAAERYEVTPDLATFGKVIGGGMPVGAFGGRRDLMEHLAPLGGVYQAGTLSGNPVAMAAGAAALQVLRDENVHAHLEALGKALEAELAPAAAETGCTLVREASIFWLAMQPDAPTAVEEVNGAGMGRYADLQAAALARGVYLAPSGWEVGFLNAAMTTDDVATVRRELAAALRETA